MVKIVSVKTDSLGYLEAQKAYMESYGRGINRKLPTIGSVDLGDASTPEPNFRAVEALFALIGLSKASPWLLLKTYIGCGGTQEMHGNTWLWPRMKPKRWKKFYGDLENIKQIPARFAPVSYMVYWAIFVRWLVISLMWIPLKLFLRPARLWIPLLTGFKVSLLERKWKDVMLSELLLGMESDQVLFTVPCPHCSEENNQTTFHAIRKMGSEAVVTKDNRSSKVETCPGALILISKLEVLSLWDITFHLGGRFSGKLTYSMLARSGKPMLMRDYSNPRGTMQAAVDAWSTDKLWVTTRIYLKRKTGRRDTPLTLLLSIWTRPRKWAEVIRKFTLISSGEQMEITY